jgi:hypothetical protein
MNLPLTKYIAVALLAIVCGTLWACASAPEVGVRPAFEKKKFPTVAVVPFYAVGNFSLSTNELDEVLRASETAAVEALRAEGFEVIEPGAFRQQLSAADVADTFDEGVLLRGPLSDYFEPSPKQSSPSLAVTTVRTLHTDGKLPSEALLFGEVVYHTETHCRVDPTEFHPRAQVIYQDKSGFAASPCVVSHFRAKLVHAPSGETMWFNHTLLQTHSGEVVAETTSRNLAQAVANTLAGSDGLHTFRAGPRTASAGDD